MATHHAIFCITPHMLALYTRKQLDLKYPTDFGKKYDVIKICFWLAQSETLRLS